MSCDPDPAPWHEVPVKLLRNFIVCVTNVNGWAAVLERPGFKGKLLPRHHYAFKPFPRHHLSLVGLVEHHLRTNDAVHSAQQLA